MNDNADTPTEKNPRNALQDNPIFQRREVNLELTPTPLEVWWGGGWELRPGCATRKFQTRAAPNEPPTDPEYRVDIHGFSGDLTELYLLLQRFTAAVEGDVFNLLAKLTECIEAGVPYTYFSLCTIYGEAKEICAVVTKVR